MIEAPLEIKLLQKDQNMLVKFSQGSMVLSCRDLRLNSPAADGQVTSDLREDINITGIEPVGQYAIRLIFNDGHATGIYTWEKLYALGEDQLISAQKD